MKQFQDPDNQDTTVLHNCGERIEKPLQGYRVDDQLAEKAGVSHDTIHKASKVIDFATEETKQKLREGKKSIGRQNKKRQIRKPVDQNSGEQNKDDRSGRTNHQISKITGIGYDTVSKFNYIQKHAEEFDEGDLIKQMCEETVDDENR